MRLKEDGDEFDTIGGLVLAKVGSMPKIGTKITINDQIMIEVIDADPRSLKKLKVTLLNGKITNEQTENAQY